jgi:molecular chaperone DnaK (HSP70)
VPTPNGKRVGIEIQQADFEQLLEPFLARVLAVSDKTLQEAGWTPADPHYLVVVGGPTAHPYVDPKMKEQYGIEPRKDISRLTAIAQGAARYGYGTERRCGGAKGWKLPPILQAITPYAIGIMVLEGDDPVPTSSVLFRKGLPAPATAEGRYCLQHLHYTSCQIQIVQCERDGQHLEACHLLGEAMFTDLPVQTVKTDRFGLNADFLSDGGVKVCVTDDISRKTVHTTTTVKKG